MADDVPDRSKRKTDPLLLPHGDRLVIDNQIKQVRAELKGDILATNTRIDQHMIDRNSEVNVFYASRWRPLEEDVDRSTKKSQARSNIAIGLAIGSLAFGIALLVIVVLLHTAT